MTLAEKIFSLRTERGMSQDDLAEKMEVSRQSVSKWETGQSTPDLDKIIKLADLFGVSVDELVREGERPQSPEPPEPKIIYVEREKQGLTPVQVLGVVIEVIGAALVLLGLIIPGVLLVILGLPLLLARKHPWLVTGWLVVAISLLILNPHTSASPWGLVGGLKYLQFLIVDPKKRYLTYYAAATVGITRGVLTLVLLYFTLRSLLRTWKNRKNPEKDG